MKRTILLTMGLALLLAGSVQAQNWDDIRRSGDYYWGVGTGTTREEATQAAMAELVNSIVVHVSSDFTQLSDETHRNGDIDHQTRVRNCVRTYSQATLSNVQRWPVGNEPNITMRCYMKKSELYHIYETRIAKARDMVAIADEALQKGKVDMALEHYYWAYSLLRSLQKPNEVRDAQGRILVNWLPTKIDEILSDIQVTFDSRDGDYVHLRFTYRGEPVNSLEYTYNDGRSNDCLGRVNDGRGMMDLIPDYVPESYKLWIEYEYKGQARGDDEMESVLDIITRRPFAKAAFTIANKQGSRPAAAARPAVAQSGSTSSDPSAQTFASSAPAIEPSKDFVPSRSQTVDNAADYAQVMSQVVTAIEQRNYSTARSCFTIDGLDMYNKLIAYGTGRIVGTPTVSFYKGPDGTVVARGLQMAFSFKTGKKKTYVEDVVFTFNRDKKIENVAFGLGRVAENDILNKCDTAGWGSDACELLTGFLENYKTAYCLKRLDYLKDVFSDDARIIVGRVLRQTQGAQAGRERQISIGGQQVIQYNRYTKDEYIDHLAQTFSRSEFINIRFSKNEVQWLTKFKDKKIFAIRIGQEYDSSRYADMGYLFLLVDLTEDSLPTIYVRTWQPNEVDIDNLYGPGDFHGL